MASREQLAHLLRRTTFGPRLADVDAAVAAGYDRTVDALLKPAGTDAAAPAAPTIGEDPYRALPKNPSREERMKANAGRRQQVDAITQWWLDRLTAAEHQLPEKLVWFWHGHWATSVRKVNSAQLMLKQHQTFRAHGLRDFAALTRAMVTDPALLIWLDAPRNTKKSPNENLARELMELFTIGVGNYEEKDVKEAARALTGWRVERAETTATLNAKQHDDGTKTILGTAGKHTAETLANLLLAQPTCPRFVAQRMWFRFASTQPAPDAVVAKMTAARFDVTAMMRVMLLDPAFLGTARSVVRQPVEWAVGAMRQLGLRPSQLPEKVRKQILDDLNAMGQRLFSPPNVGGWPAGESWLTTASTEGRLRLAELLSNNARTVTTRLAALPAASRPAELAKLLVVDAWTERTRAVLAATPDPKRALTLALASPEYAVC